MNFLNNYKVIKNEIFELKTETKIIIVTKNQSFDNIVPIINDGHLHFGENKVQEANLKWGNFLKNEKKIKLHLIGKLQTNKAKDAFDLFDYIHTLYIEKLAKILSILESKSEKKIIYFF